MALSFSQRIGIWTRRRLPSPGGLSSVAAATSIAEPPNPHKEGLRQLAEAQLKAEKVVAQKPPARPVHDLMATFTQPRGRGGCTRYPEKQERSRSTATEPSAAGLPERVEHNGGGRQQPGHPLLDNSTLTVFL